MPPIIEWHFCKNLWVPGYFAIRFQSAPGLVFFKGWIKAVNLDSSDSVFYKIWKFFHFGGLRTTGSYSVT